MIELTHEQHEALNGETLPQVHDPETNETYVLVRTDVFERMRAILDGITRRAGWDDPNLDVYEQYRKKA